MSKERSFFFRFEAQWSCSQILLSEFEVEISEMYIPNRLLTCAALINNRPESFFSQKRTLKFSF